MIPAHRSAVMRLPSVVFSGAGVTMIILTFPMCRFETRPKYHGAPECRSFDMPAAPAGAACTRIRREALCASGTTDSNTPCKDLRKNRSKAERRWPSIPKPHRPTGTLEHSIPAPRFPILRLSASAGPPNGKTPPLQTSRHSQLPAMRRVESIGRTRGASIFHCPLCANKPDAPRRRSFATTILQRSNIPAFRIHPLPRIPETGLESQDFGRVEMRQLPVGKTLIPGQIICNPRADQIDRFTVQDAGGRDRA